MSYTPTVKRNRKRTPKHNEYMKSMTETDFHGEAVSGDVTLCEWNHTDDLSLDIDVHANEKAVVTAVKGDDWNFAVVNIQSYHENSDILRSAEATVFVTLEQARALRDSLIALDI